MSTDDRAGRDLACGIAGALAEMSQEIERLGTSLCADPSVVKAHIGDLQAIDLMSQKLGVLASLLRAECHVTAIDAIHLDHMKDHFSQFLTCNIED